MTKILITGGTGLIGKELSKRLINLGFSVNILSRTPKKNNEYKWNINEEYIDDNAFENITHIIHLAGAGIADKRWTNNRKKELINSRVKSTNLLLKKVRELNINLQGFIAASGVGYYGAISSDTIFTEKDNPFNDFIAKVCVQWENAVNQFKKLQIPVTIFRTSVVLSKKGGALQKINTPLFLSILGNGKQYIPWIHINDLCNLYIKAIKEPHFNGVYNAVAPEFTTFKGFINMLSKTTNKPIFPINVPVFILKIILGEMASILTFGSRISAKNIAVKYDFIFSNLSDALNNIYKEDTKKLR